jgi:hypothetical protein
MPSDAGHEDASHFAEEAGLPHLCPATACAKAKRCRARCRPVAHRPQFSCPPCLAAGFEEIYAPYQRYLALCRWLVDAEAKLKAMPTTSADPMPGKP